ncbi:hypothetical protein DL765_005871 [Monosporascus sp. GIB2]|nr:hypothetical protein DL765_005871 [Monosporascus sp. GIB2]
MGSNYLSTPYDNATSLLLRQSGHGDYAFLRREGSAAYYSALYLLALHRAAELAPYLGKNQDAARWRGRARLSCRPFSISSGIPPPGHSSTVIASVAVRIKLFALLKHTSIGNAFYDEGGNDLGGPFSTRIYAFISYFEIAAGHHVLGEYRPGGLEAPGSVHESGARLADRRHAATEQLRPRRQAAQARARGVDCQADTGERAVGKGGGPDSLRVAEGFLGEEWRQGDMEVHAHAPEGTNGTVSVPAGLDDAEGRRALLRGIPGIAEMATGGYIVFRVEDGEKQWWVIPKPRNRRGGCGSEAGVGTQIRMPGSGPEAFMAVWN